MDKQDFIAFQTQAAAIKPTLSFEFFPPKTDEAEEVLWQNILKLEALNPAFVSVTYGAGGSTRERTHRLVKRIREQTSLKAAAHLTCVGSSRDEIRRLAETYLEIGITHLVALRGDPPSGESHYIPHPQGYAYADTLVAGLKEVGDFEISVAAYPEMHPQAESPEADLAHLQRKFAAGADRAITQYFFDIEPYLSFIDHARAMGITQPIVPGILPIVNYAQMVRFSAMCGAQVPDWIHARFQDIDDASLQYALAVATAAEMCKLLLMHGATHLHFYTLNRADLVTAICRMLP